MSQRAIVSISCVRQAGLLAAVSERLFELGCNLADTTYALLAGSAEFTTVCELPDGMAEETLALELHRTPLLAGARIVVGPFDPAASEARSQRITHRFEISGPDRPGKIVRLSAAFAKCGAEIVRLNSQKSVTGGVRGNHHPHCRVPARRRRHRPGHRRDRRPRPELQGRDGPRLD